MTGNALPQLWRIVLTFYVINCEVAFIILVINFLRQILEGRLNAS